MKEKLIEKKLVCRTKEMGGLALKLTCLGFAGLPDRLILLPGAKLGFAEVKETGMKPRPLQVNVMKMLSDLGFVVKVVDSLESMDEFFKVILK
jgi:hypothetical protein